MKRRPRIYYSDGQKAQMWERWKEGWTLQEIGKLFDRPHTSIQKILARAGGIRPADRRRAATALTLAEREEISRSIVAGESIRSIAARLERAPSTISREIKRNGDRDAYDGSSHGDGDHRIIFGDGDANGDPDDGSELSDRSGRHQRRRALRYHRYDRQHGCARVPRRPLRREHRWREPLGTAGSQGTRDRAHPGHPVR